MPTDAVARSSDRARHQVLDEAKRRKWSTVLTMLEEDPSLVNVQPAGRWSALHQAAEADELQIVQALLFRFDASLQVRTSDGRSPIDVAGEKCKQLLQAAARFACARRFRPTPESRGDALLACRQGARHEQCSQPRVEGGGVARVARGHAPRCGEFYQARLPPAQARACALGGGATPARALREGCDDELAAARELARRSEAELAAQLHASQVELKLAKDLRAQLRQLAASAATGDELHNKFLQEGDFDLKFDDVGAFYGLWAAPSSALTTGM